eukprot:c9330_g1_i1.p1 GENE.c9330_g1_i1~~c9330_g1_i1.p1  ORF type:complete len:405 (-),score=98.32 c9330_g1_i1:205-1344(-)
MDNTTAPKPPSPRESLNSERNSLCIVCEDSPRTVRLPCGHAYLCVGCTKRLLQENQPCPTCRAPFSKFYRTNVGGSQAAFLNPETHSLKEFGKLQRMSIKDATLLIIQHIRSRLQQIIRFLCITTLLFIIISIAILPLLLSVIEFSIGASGLKHHCDLPLPEWLIAVGTIHLLSWIHSVRRSLRPPETNRAQTKSDQKVTAGFRFMYIIALIIGAVFAYSTNECDRTVLLYSWCVVTISICMIGILFTIWLLACGFHFCSGTRSTQPTGDETGFETSLAEAMAQAIAHANTMQENQNANASAPNPEVLMETGSVAPSTVAVPEDQVPEAQDNETNVSSMMPQFNISSSTESPLTIQIPNAAETSSTTQSPEPSPLPPTL